MLVATTDTKVAATPSSNSFAFRLAASIHRVRLKRIAKIGSSFGREPAVTLNKTSRSLETALMASGCNSDVVAKIATRRSTLLTSLLRSPSMKSSPSPSRRSMCPSRRIRRFSPGAQVFEVVFRQ
jgi:hypothetical protein